MQAMRTILVYHDFGCCEQSTQALVSQLERTAGKWFQIRVVDSDYLRKTSWERDTFGLAMGGGSCSAWERLLQEAGMQKIHNFVVGGGRYLGICAGAYFGSAYSFFLELGQIPLIKARPLRFYQGSAVGPINRTENHLLPQAALAAKVELLQSAKSGYCYYQGGPAFDISESSPFTKVLLKYDFGWAAGISNRVGHGSAVMCGLHPEFVWNKSEADQALLLEFRLLADTLAQQEAFRQEIWHTLINEFLS